MNMKLLLLRGMLRLERGATISPLYNQKNKKEFSGYDSSKYEK